MDRKIHGDKAYAAGAPERLGWYRTHLSASLELIERTGIEKKARLIDVGGGAAALHRAGCLALQSGGSAA
jgi:hypothetical protein